MVQQALEIISLVREYVRSGEVDKIRLDNLQRTLAFAMDESKVNNRPTEDIEQLYDAVLWLKCDVLGYE